MSLPSQLQKKMQLAYSAEKAAAFAYRGHAKSVSDPADKKAIKDIEDDEWNHRQGIRQMMAEHGVKVSRWYEIKYAIIGKIISASCFVIGWFMPMYFAGRLESGNVNDYLEMQQMFGSLRINNHKDCLSEMARKEKEHEMYFMSKIATHWLTPVFQKLFRWGPNTSFNTLPRINQDEDAILS